MKTIKLNIINDINIQDEQRIFNNILRISFNRFQDGLKDTQVRHYISKYFSENSWFMCCAVAEGKAMYNRFKNQKIIFGGKYNLKQYLLGKINKETYKQNRLQLISIQGEQKYGNRLFNFDFKNNKIIYKRNKNEHKEIYYKPLKKKLNNELLKIQELIKEKKITVSVRFDAKNIMISFDETIISNEKYKNLKINRILGLDINPGYIGLSIIEFNNKNKFNILNKQVFDFSELTKKSGKSSSNILTKKLNNKLKYELIDIIHKIDKLVNIWKCSKIALEDLDFKNPDKNVGHEVKRLRNNVWNRLLLKNKIKMLAAMHGYQIEEINPAYSSIIGNILYGNKNTPDMIAASIEIARRAYKKYEKGWFYPKFKIQYHDEQWKQTLDMVKSWKELFLQIKKSKLKYRFQLNDYIQNAVFSKKYIKQKYKIYKFI